MSQKNIFKNRPAQIFSADVVIRNLHDQRVSKYFESLRWFSGIINICTYSVENSKNDVGYKKSLIVIGDFATKTGIDLATQLIEFIRNTEENIRISFVSSTEKLVSKRIFCTSMSIAEAEKLMHLSQLFSSVSIPVKEDNLGETGKDCDSQFEIYASIMYNFIKELNLESGRTYIIFNGRVNLVF